MPDLQKQAPVFRVASYNVENYLDDTASRCCVKSAASKTKVRECIRALRPDVLALQEMGSCSIMVSDHPTDATSFPIGPSSGWPPVVSQKIRCVRL